ncbi:hypothetical protein, partial [Thiohalorhabdus sp.]|uniref:hypothetical protein n=1 Tax=Thiohalorhabdus sp. TaxID=3094134 RepID=UPI002FC31510
TCLNGEALDDEKDWEEVAAEEGYEFVLSITDHGNATLYRAKGNGIGDAPRIVGYEDVWSVV